MIIQAVRSIIFYGLFLGQTAILAIVLGTLSLFHKGWFPAGWAIAKYWAASTLVILRWMTGIRSEISGMENIPEGGCIIAAKHQSDWDIFALMPHVGRPAFIAKKELMDIPFFGWSARAMDSISIDRKKGGDAIAAMTEDARAAAARGCRIIIYPEGTRKAALADPSYRTGISRIYDKLNVPVVPVALNSGLFWARNSLVLWPGTAEAKFLTPIPAGLPPAEMHARMVAQIEEATEALMVKAAKKGLSRPMDAGFRAKIDKLLKKQTADKPS